MQTGKARYSLSKIVNFTVCHESEMLQYRKIIGKQIS